MKNVYQLPKPCYDRLREDKETGIGYQVVAVELKNAKHFEQVVVSEGCIIEVRGYKEIPFSPDEIQSVSVNHKQWNFRDGSDARVKSRAAAACA